MAIQLTIEHVDGLRLRQQVHRASVDPKTGTVTKTNEWVFQKDPLNRNDLEVPRVLDPRTREPTKFYMPVINGGVQNLVIDKKGTPAPVSFRNTSLRNTIRIRTFVQMEEKRPGAKEGEKEQSVRAWRPNLTPVFLGPQEVGGVVVGDGVRAFVEELPT